MTMLDKLYYDLQTYEPTTQNIQTTAESDRGKSLGGLFSKLTSALKFSSTSADLIARPQSLYIYGGAGCGKVYSLKFVSLCTSIDLTESPDGHLLRMYANQCETTHSFQQFHARIS
jgi:predicted ATPase